MGKYIREIKTETLSVSDLVHDICAARGATGKCPRLVMATCTLNKLRKSAPGAVQNLDYAEAYAMRARTTFSGCPIDRNETLFYGEILITVEV